MLNKFVLLMLGGGAGTVCRYFMAEWATSRWGVHMPHGTFLVNMTGCLLIGILLGVFELRFGSFSEAPLPLRVLLVSGFLGGLTTFSSYELETMTLFRQGALDRALVYCVGSVVLGLLMLLVGFKVTRLVLEGRI